jgi:uncharacterized protein
MKGRVIAAVILASIVLGTILGLVLTLADSDESGAIRDGDVVTVQADGARVRAEVAATDRSRNRGLAGRSKLGPREGMLFVFDSAGPRDFWMRGVSFPLDMIWIRGGRVVGVTRNARPESETGERLYPSPGLIDRVLEVQGGWAAKRSVERGDRYGGP